MARRRSSCGEGVAKKRQKKPDCGRELEACAPVGGCGDDEALEELVRRFRCRAPSITGFHGIPRQEAEDLVQQTLVTYLCRRDEVHSPDAWLAGTLSQRCRMFWRSKQRSWLSTVETEILEAAGSRQAPPQDGVAMRRDLTVAVARLPERWRSLVRLKFGLELDSKETARRLGYRHSGIYTITKRCLAALAKELESLGWQEPGCRSAPGPLPARELASRRGR